MEAITRKISRMSAVLLMSMNAWIDHRDSSKGAALAFYTLFSIAPILVLAIMGAGYFLGSEAAQGGITLRMEEMVGRNGAQAIEVLLAGASEPSRGLLATMVASLILLVGTTSVFVELKSSLDELWGIEPPKGLATVSFLRTRLHCFGIVLVLAFLMLVSLVLSTALAILERHAVAIFGSSYDMLSMISSLITFGVIASLFAVIFKVLPDVPLTWRDAWIGAVFTAGLFSFGKYVIGLYLGANGVASNFGTAWPLIALLLWIYYSAQAFFLGAEFTRRYALEFGSLQHIKNP